MRPPLRQPDVRVPETVARVGDERAADNALAAEIRVGYAFTGPAIQSERRSHGVTHPEARVQILPAVMNRHGTAAPPARARRRRSS